MAVPGPASGARLVRQGPLLHRSSLAPPLAMPGMPGSPLSCVESSPSRLYLHQAIGQLVIELLRRIRRGAVSWLVHLGAGFALAARGGGGGTLRRRWLEPLPRWRFQRVGRRWGRGPRFGSGWDWRALVRDLYRRSCGQLLFQMKVGISAHGSWHCTDDAATRATTRRTIVSTSCFGLRCVPRPGAKHKTALAALAVLDTAALAIR